MSYQKPLPLSTPERLPEWLRIDPAGPHACATGFNPDKDGVASYCTKCGIRWRDCLVSRS